MNKFSIIIGVLLILVGIIWGGIITWSNPDMTSRRLWIEFTWELISISVVTITGGNFACPRNKKRVI